MKTFISVLIGLSVVTGLRAQVPLFNSFPSARATLFLDFDGQYVTGTSWNWSGPIDAQPSGLTNSQITEIFNRVAEDYRIFNINITTDSTVYNAAPARQRMRLIITPTYQWYGAAGGISYVGSFAWGDGTPAWVFSGLLGYSPKKIAEAISHEGGHTLGLEHQSSYTSTCTKTEYNSGAGSGETGWAPIMGVGYYQNVTTWNYGTSTVGCTTYQDDIGIIAGSTNNFGLRTDDFGNTHTSATSIGFTGTGFSTNGLVNTGTDKDVFKFTLNAPTYVHLSAVPQNVGTLNSGANLDIKMSLLNWKADTLGTYNPINMVSASLDSNLSSGTYYVVVEGTGNTYLEKNSSVGNYTLSANPITALPIRRIALSGNSNAGVHTLNWSYETDEEVKQIEIQDSKDGINFEAITTMGANSKTFAYKPLTTSALYYRIRIITVNEEKSYYSNIITLYERNDNTPVKVMNTLVTNSVMVNTDNEYSYQLIDASGRRLQAGQLAKGANRIDVSPTAQSGLLLLRIQDAGQGWTWKLIKQ